MRSVVTLAMMIALGAVDQLWAQVIFQSAPVTARRVVVASGSVAPAAATPTAQPAAADSGGDLKQQRLQKIQQLQFDRRPSAILKAWLELTKEQKAKTESEEASPAEPNKQAAADEHSSADQKDQGDADKPDAEVKDEADSETKTEESTSDKPDASTADNEATDEESGNKADGDADDKSTEKSDESKPGDDGAEEPAGDEEQAKQKAKQEADKKKAEQEKKKAEQAAALKQFEKQLTAFQRDVTLGRWGEVKSFVAGLEEEEAKALYARLLDGLRSGPQPNQAANANPQLLQQMIMDSADQATIQAVLSASGQGPGAAFVEKNRFSMNDIAGLVDAAPHELDEDCFTKLGTILRMTLADGHDLNELLETLDKHVDVESKSLSQRDVARLLCASGQEVRAGDYLPSIDEAAGDAQALNLLARYFLAQNAREKKAAHLENAWRATQGVLALETPPDEPKAEPDTAQKETSEPKADDSDAAEAASDEEKAKHKAEEEAEKKKAEAAKKKRDALRQEITAALARAVQLAPQLPDELGQKWLDESFTTRLERGHEILVTLGTQVSMNLQSRPHDADARLKSLQLQKAAVESLLRAAPKKAEQWADALTLLAAHWLKEAEVSHRFDQQNQFGSMWRRDRYGNYYHPDPESGDTSVYRYQNVNNVRAIPSADVLDTRPDDVWLGVVSADLRPKFAMTTCQLHLKLEEEAAAFPYIEQLATTHPEQARDLAGEFLRVWTRNHDPNERREDQNPFVYYYYRYEQRAERIPLTRSKQERNLEELGQWLRRLRALPFKELDEELLAKAFTTSHSQAEVYRLEAIEDVFGSIDSLKPRTLAELIQQMRGNLAGVWRMPDVQKQNSTNRKKHDIEAEVRRGYELARSVVRQALERNPDHWALMMADAAVMHDENEFQQELNKSSEFSERRRAALARYREAAERYAAVVDEMTEEEQTTKVYEQWFYAGLGAVDLERITADKVADQKQPAMIRDAIMALPAEIADDHLAKFANNLFTRVSSAKPELKYRYLRSGFEIVGDHKLAREARKLLDYYGDLVSEIKLETKIDGSDVVGHDEPFGAFVNILHTKEIERESGGFGRYLQNQNSGNRYYYNFGRPTENYRDKFRDTVTQALGEQFEVISITFQEPDVNSKAGSKYGWRVTPYAYLLLKARGPEVDKIAPLRLDFDFLDTSGYAMLPVESPVVPIDAQAKKAAARPATQIELVQTLDERQSDEGKLILEVRASGRGLMPRLDDLVDLEIPGFQQQEVEGGDLAVTQFDKEADDTVIASERVWLITMHADDAEQVPETFRFAKAKMVVKENVYQRYEDADLVAVEPEISLAARYGEDDYAWAWIPLVALGVVVVGGVLAARFARRTRDQAPQRFHVPQQITPFSVLGLLRDIQHNNGLDDAEHRELADSIDRLERHYFAAPDTDEPDLQGIATTWVAKTASRN